MSGVFRHALNRLFRRDEEKDNLPPVFKSDDFRPQQKAPRISDSALRPGMIDRGLDKMQAGLRSYGERLQKPTGGFVRDRIAKPIAARATAGLEAGLAQSALNRTETRQRARQAGSMSDQLAILQEPTTGIPADITTGKRRFSDMDKEERQKFEDMFVGVGGLTGVNNATRNIMRAHKTAPGMRKLTLAQEGAQQSRLVDDGVSAAEDVAKARTRRTQETLGEMDDDLTRRTREDPGLTGTPLGAQIPTPLEESISRSPASTSSQSSFRPSRDTSSPLKTRPSSDAATMSPSSLTSSRTKSPSKKYTPTTSSREIMEDADFNAIYNAAKKEEPYLTNIISELAEGRNHKVGVKEKKTAAGKILRKLPKKPDYTEKDLGDLVRGNIVAKNNDDAMALTARLHEKAEVVSVEDYISNPNAFGYQGININIRTPNGVMGEVQIHTPESIKVQKAIHPIYTKYRDQIDKTGITPFKAYVESWEAAEKAKAKLPLISKQKISRSKAGGVSMAGKRQISDVVEQAFGQGSDITSQAHGVARLRLVTQDLIENTADTKNKVAKLKALRAEINKQLRSYAGLDGVQHWKQEFSVAKTMKENPDTGKILQQMERSITNIDEALEKMARGETVRRQVPTPIDRTKLTEHQLTKTNQELQQAGVQQPAQSKTPLTEVQPTVAKTPLVQESQPQLTKPAAQTQGKPGVAGGDPPGGRPPATPDDTIVIENGKILKKKKPEKFQFDVDSINTEDDVKESIRKLVQDNLTGVQTARRGSISETQIRRLADSLGMTAEDVAKRKPGEIFNAEEIDAATRLATKVQEDLFAIGKEIQTLREAGKEIPEALQLKQIEKAELARGVWASVIGSSSESGRALKARQMTKEAMENPSAKATRKVLQEFAGDEEKAKKVLQQLSLFDPEDTVGMTKFLRKVKPSTLIEKLEEIWYNSLLSNTATHVINNSSTFTATYIRPLETAVAGVIDAVGHKFAKTMGFAYKRDRFLGEATAEMVAQRRGWTTGIRRATHVLKHGITEQQLTKMDEKYTRALKGKFGDFINIPLKVMVVSDELWRGINYEMGINKLAYRLAKTEGLKGKALERRIGELIANPDEKMIEQATNESTRRLFQAHNEVSRKLTAMRDLGVNIPKLGKFKPLRFVIPFIKTPMNVVSFGLERTPLGFLEAGRKAATGASKADVVDQLAKAAVGSMILAPIAIYAAEDKLTGRTPANRTAKDAFYADGKLPHALKVGNYWIPYNRFSEPFNTMFAMVANWHEAFGGEDEVTMEQIAKFGYGMMRNVTDQTMLGGLSRFLDAVEDPERYASKFLADIAGGFMPYSALSGAAARSVDPVVRDPKTLTDSFKQKIPGLSQQVQPLTSEFEPDGVATRKQHWIDNFTGVRRSPDQGRDLLPMVEGIQNANKERMAEAEADKEIIESVYQNLKKAPKEDRANLAKMYVESGYINDNNLDTIMDRFVSDAVTGSRDEQANVLTKYPHNTRARFVVDRIVDMDPGERANYVRDLYEQGVINDTTLEHMTEELLKKKNAGEASQTSSLPMVEF